MVQGRPATCRQLNPPAQHHQRQAVTREQLNTRERIDAFYGQLLERLRAVPGVKKVNVASGVRYDLAVESPEYVKELVQHHVGGYLKIAPEHTEQGPLSKMMKPGIGTYDRFKTMFDKYSEEVGKKQFLIPYFIAAHPGTSDEDMMNLALWLKRNGFRADQVQTFYPSPMATATAMYHSSKNPLRKISRDSEAVETPRLAKIRKFHKALLRWHDPENWEVLREGLKRIGRSDLIGNGPQHLVPRSDMAATTAAARRPRRDDTPSIDRIAKKFGHKTVRAGAAIARKRRV